MCGVLLLAGVATSILIATASALAFPSRLALDEQALGVLAEAEAYSMRVEDWPPPPRDPRARIPVLSRPCYSCPPRERPRANVEVRPAGRVVIISDHEIGEQLGLTASYFPDAAVRTVEQQPWMYTYQHARGWPLPALGSTWDQQGVAIIGSGDDAIRIPLLPIWPGLAANTAIFASLWAIPTLTIPAIRRHRRARAGRCHACGYDITTLPRCPECGTHRPDPPTMQ